jgi:hypothetical protein
MISTEALKYLPQMGLHPSRVVGCAAAKCQNSFALADGFAVEAIVAGKFSIAFFCSADSISTRSHRTVVRGCDDTAAGLQASSLRSLWRAFRHGDPSLVGNKFCKRTCKDAYLHETYAQPRYNPSLVQLAFAAGYFQTPLPTCPQFRAQR